MVPYKKRNFCSGPAHLPEEVIAQAQEAIQQLPKAGLSVLEIYHRDKRYLDLLEEVQALVRELGKLKDNQKVLFLHGGAKHMFDMVPANLLRKDAEAAYIDTGRWSAMAMEEASIYGKAIAIASSRANAYKSIPSIPNLEPDYAYLHITTNNTIMGTQFQTIPEVDVPVVADMSSDIFSCTRGFDKVDIAYASAQKNIGIAGMTMVIINEDLDFPVRSLGRMMDLRQNIEAQSNLNTPPVFAIYVCLLMLRWIQSKGLKQLEKANQKKAERFYQELDRNPLFEGYADPASRSRMNATFFCTRPEDEARFIEVCAEAGVEQIRGHRALGGLRIAMYNAIPSNWVDDMIDIMQFFEKRYG